MVDDGEVVIRLPAVVDTLAKPGDVETMSASTKRSLGVQVAGISEPQSGKEKLKQCRQSSPSSSSVQSDNAKQAEPVNTNLHFHPIFIVGLRYLSKYKRYI
jgi:hypothetical protein